MPETPENREDETAHFTVVSSVICDFYEVILARPGSRNKVFGTKISSLLTLQVDLAIKRDRRAGEREHTLLPRETLRMELLGIEDCAIEQ